MRFAQPVELSVDGPLARLTLNRPNKRNALSEAMWTAMASLLAYVEEEPEIKVLIVSGAGGHFSAGADIDEFERVYADVESANAYADLMRASLGALDRCRKPTIAAVEGYCYGAGLMLALACDLRLAAPSARFCLPPAKLGLAYPFEDIGRLVRVVGQAHARSLLFTARVADPTEAARIGLAEPLIEASDAANPSFEARIDEYAHSVASLSQASIHASKAMLAVLEAGQTEEDDDLRTSFIDAVFGPDFAEARKARKEGRPAVFPWKSESLFSD
jgi:enoyl-CoA hydratase/carnithine racemase